MKDGYQAIHFDNWDLCIRKEDVAFICDAKLVMPFLLDGIEYLMTRVAQLERGMRELGEYAMEGAGHVKGEVAMSNRLHRIEHLADLVTGQDTVSKCPHCVP